jgi:hypothetical protein
MQRGAGRNRPGRDAGVLRQKAVWRAAGPQRRRTKPGVNSAPAVGRDAGFPKDSVWSRELRRKVLAEIESALTTRSNRP